MTPDQVNALPEDVRKYIHDLESNCDPAGNIQQITSLQEQVRALTAQAVRRRLPETRPSITRKCTACGFEMYVIVGFYDDPPDQSKPAEVFVSLSKHGTELSGMMDGVCISLSVALQSGVPWEVFKSKFEFTRFGQQDEAHTSLLDGLVKAIDHIIKTRKDSIGE